MRLIAAALAAMGLAACDASVQVDGADGAGGYLLEVRASESEQFYLVTAPDGRVAAARVAEGQSLLMDDTRTQALLGAPVEAGDTLPRIVSLQIPGFGFSIHGQDSTDGDSARISIHAGGRRIEVDARDGGVEGADRAYVRIAGADAGAARDFIAEAERLSPDVQAQMRQALGLEQVP